ncbi:30S ribosomal protein S13 [Staphylococcus gallinarum]|uniref:30S ribosomal protein S13 n=1 Tax=Staphylococcus gallinarum TaxID=1293 RepID=A0A380FL00_STAGA|nr:30S ribosomal protein S13 [Staphylococcus gallinarum]
MARIAGVDIPREKRIVILINIMYMVSGTQTANKIVEQANVSADTRTKDLTGRTN